MGPLEPSTIEGVTRGTPALQPQGRSWLAVWHRQPGAKQRRTVSCWAGPSDRTAPLWAFSYTGMVLLHSSLPGVPGESKQNTPVVGLSWPGAIPSLAAEGLGRKKYVKLSSPPH